MAAQWRTGDGAPYWRDAQIRPPQIIHAAQIPAAYTPRLHKTPGAEKTKKTKRGWLHKTPGAEKTKKPKRVTPGAPPHRITRRGFYAF